MYDGQGRGPWRRGPFRGNTGTRSRGVNVRNRNTGGSFSPNQAGRFVPQEQEVSEALNCAVVDSGCTSNVVADSTLDFVSDCITMYMYGKREALMHTSGGNYCIPISSKPAAIMQPSHASSIKVFLTTDHLDKKTI